MKIKGLLITGMLLTPVIVKDFQVFENIEILNEETIGNVDIFEDVEYGIEDVEYSIDYVNNKECDLHFYLPKEWVEVEDISISGVQKGYKASKISSGYNLEYIDEVFGENDIEWVENNELIIEDAGTFISYYEIIGNMSITHTDLIPPKVTDELLISFQGKDGIKDTYSFQSDEFDGVYKNRTQSNMYDLKLVNGKELQYDNPFLTKNNTFKDLESLIRGDRLIESKYNFPYDFTEFIFLDENGDEIDKDSHLDSSTINLRLESNGSSSDVIGSKEMSFKIPFLGDLKINLSEDLNIYDFDEEDPFSNHSSYKWVLENGVWTLKTNVPFDIKFSGKYIEYIDESGFEDEYWIHPSQSYSKDHTQIKDKESNSVSKKITLTNIEGYEWSFKYEFNANNNNNSIVEAETYNKDDLLVEDSLSYLDVNNNGKEESDEIYEANVVNNGVKVDVKSEDVKVFELTKTGVWKSDPKVDIADESETTKSVAFMEEGIYAVTGEDEYGNVSFEVIEYLPFLSTDLQQSKLTKLNKTDMYINNQSIAKNNYGIDNDDFSDYSAHEQRKIDDFINGNNISPLATAIKISSILLSIFLVIVSLIGGYVFYKKKKDQNKIDDIKKQEDTIYKSELIQSLQEDIGEE